MLLNLARGQESVRSVNMFSGFELTKIDRNVPGVDWCECRVNEAKMKSRKGKGTPHPKGRRSLVHTSYEEDDSSSQIQHSEPDQVLRTQTKSPLQNLLHIHTQVTQTLQQIDTMVLSIHKLSSSNHIAPEEVQDFADALTSIDENLQDWNSFFETAAKRSSASRNNLDQEPCNLRGPESTPIRGENCATNCSLVADLESGSISYSPLVATALLNCKSPCGSEPLIFTPPDSTGCVLSSTELTPSPQTPRLTRVLSTVSESPSLSTPSDFVSFLSKSDAHQSLGLEELLTAEYSTCRTNLVFETPLAQVIRHEQLNDCLVFPETPGFSFSPPRTCRPLRPGETASMESDPVPPTPVVPSPFRTPGILLKCNGKTMDSSSADSPGIIDDITASTMKRLGPRGLEERLWQELTFRRADILQSTNIR
ncbi:uncharacterized protein [Physcomitrium patens]|nr:uncharacterized protein LOC112286392 isoform X1 [Physcomitrium patens]|eukprot:XP_024384013.1 uncharacterized protein LOC112286392 isoform X1 [Physcomitrella patens]